MQIFPGEFSSAAGYAGTEKEQRVLASLDAHSIPYTGVRHVHADTIADCRAVEEVLGAPICKNLFLCNARKTAYYLLILPGEKVFKTKYLSKQIGASRLSFGNTADMERLINCTPGSASALGLLFNTDHSVRFLIDKDLLAFEYWGFHPCRNTATLRLRHSDFMEIFLPSIGVSPTVVELPDGRDEAASEKKQEK